MSNSPEPRQEYPSTYVVQDRSNEEELIRLRDQDMMHTTAMGGVLPEQPDPSGFRRVLDVACGTGGWLIETAKTYPTITRLVGVDVSERMITYARTQAQAQQVTDRVQFRTMDALRILEFPPNTFDLVNMRAGTGFLRTWEWPKLLREFQRVARPGGVIRITEPDMSLQNTSPALTKLNQLLIQAFHQAGHFFTPFGDGVINQLARLLQQYGLQNVQTQTHTIVFRAGTADWQYYYDDARRAYRTLVPFLRKWTRVPEDYETNYQQMLSEMQQPDFVANLTLLTAWGHKPLKKEQRAPTSQ